MSDIYEDFWAIFAESDEAPEHAAYQRCCYFGKTDDESVDEVQSMLRGAKTAISHCIPYYLKNRIPLPKIGDYTIVTDFIGNPGCIVETVDVHLDPVEEIPPELAKKEHPDKTHEEWIAWRHEENRDLAKRFGFPFTRDLGVLVEEVRLIYPKNWLGKDKI